jgi:CRP/FNR family transcriptional regulator, anaerobic regulatory protein
MEELLAWLNAIHPLSPPLLERLRKLVRCRTISRKEYLLEAGHVNREICFIGKGIFRCFYLKNGKDVSSWFMKEGDVIVSVESFYEQVNSYEYIQALEDCEIFYISYEQLHDIYNEFMEFNFIGRMLTVKYLILWTRQLYNIRMMSARERYQYIVENTPDLLQRVPGRQLASFLDIDEATFYRIKNER